MEFELSHLFRTTSTGPCLRLINYLATQEPVFAPLYNNLLLLLLSSLFYYWYECFDYRAVPRPDLSMLPLARVLIGNYSFDENNDSTRVSASNNPWSGVVRALAVAGPAVFTLPNMSGDIPQGSVKHRHFESLSRVAAARVTCRPRTQSRCRVPLTLQTFHYPAPALLEFLTPR